MSEPENFLTRWSRRKQADAEAAMAPEADAPAGADEPRSAAADEDPNGVAKPCVEAAEPVFDLQSLPPIESITADTDIRVFLAPGVPLELARAALRRAWATDAKIRDFIGPADYAWDYHAPGSMPGFGPLEMTDELRQAVARIVGFATEDAPPGTPARSTAQPRSYENTNEANLSAEPPGRSEPLATGGAQESAGNTIAEASARDELTPCGKDPAALPHEPKQSVILDSTTRRVHGGALPK